MAVHSQPETNFLLKSIELVMFHQVAKIVIYLSCFGWDLLRSR
ncbi:MAG: hypothetical protein QNJ68_23420 [Microcoleaceae cyanobacterium MO_207.B10]|nr:hypothetical protein [Microcoleaceae cyanobacterium MO_207.B10]